MGAKRGLDTVYESYNGHHGNWSGKYGITIRDYDAGVQAEMMPSEYQWLLSEAGPRMLAEALRLYGTQEAHGDRNALEIMGWAKETGQRAYTMDSIPWCGLFMAVVAHRAGKPPDNSPLWARSWADWGHYSAIPMLGDVLVFSRDGGGHVGLYVGEDNDYYHVLGGNQRDSVRIDRILKKRMIAARRYYKTAAPKNVRRVLLAPTGAISTNEA